MNMDVYLHFHLVEIVQLQSQRERCRIRFGKVKLDQKPLGQFP